MIILNKVIIIRIKMEILIAIGFFVALTGYSLAKKQKKDNEQGFCEL